MPIFHGKNGSPRPKIAPFSPYYLGLSKSYIRPTPSAEDDDATEPFDEIVPVFIVFKYPPPFDPTTNDVVQRSRSVYS